MHVDVLLPALLSFAVLTGCGAPDVRPAPVAAPAVMQTPTPPPTSAPTPTPSPAGEQVTVLRVKDGDSFLLVDGREVRVLGIDSCELSSPAGPAAKAAAAALLNGTTITLRSEPGVELDRFDRMLRYVDVPSSHGLLDFGVEMVGADHTGIYAGHNDASPSYLDLLRDADHGGRNCDAGAAIAPRAAVAAPVRPTPKTATKTKAATPPSKASSGGSFSSCAAARAAGAAPVHRGEAGYSSRLDRDGDGVGCE